jgi:hypothetical protein
MYALSSDLFNASSVCAIVVLLFDDEWRSVVGRRVVPLPTQGCSAYKIELCSGRGASADGTSTLVVSELACAKLFQVKTDRLLSSITKLDEVVEQTSLDGGGIYEPECPGTGYEVRRYTMCTSATDGADEGHRVW